MDEKSTFKGLFPLLVGLHEQSIVIRKMGVNFTQNELHSIYMKIAKQIGFQPEFERSRVQSFKNKAFIKYTRPKRNCRKNVKLQG